MSRATASGLSASMTDQPRTGPSPGASTRPFGLSVSVPAIGSTSTISVVVTAQDLSTTGTYTLTLSQDPGNDAALSALSVNGTAVNGFSSAMFAYAIGVANGSTSVTVTPTVRGVVRPVCGASKTVTV